MKKDKKLTWRRLDNSAKIFPLATGKKYSTVFRFSVVLNEKINKIVLEKAVKNALHKYKLFKVKMKQGFFWYYFEENSKKLKIEEERDYPCEYIDPRKNNDYLFKVTYFENKINIDIFHSLTDGNSGITFFKEIIYTYLEMLHPEVLNEERRIRKIDNDYDSEDSYLENYSKKSKNDIKNKKAHILKGKKIRLGAISAIHQIMNLEDVKREAKKYNVSVTAYLTSVLIYAIYQENYLKNKGKKPIKICVPVNLKKYFNSKTISNFFSYITVEAEMKNLEQNQELEQNKNTDIFSKIVEFTKKEFEEKLKEEEILKTMSSNVKIGTNPIIKVTPLILKKLFVRLSYLEIRKYTTTTYSNIGRIGIIGKYQEYIKYFLMLIAPEKVEKIKCSSCTFENKMVFTFTSVLKDNSIEKKFYEILKENNIYVELESNGVLDDISTENK